MRPKIVILTLAVAIGIVALAVVLRGVMGGHKGDRAPDAPSEEAGPPETANVQANPSSTNSQAVLAELRAAELAKEMDQVREMQASGAGDPGTIELLLRKVTSREPDVRKAAVEALVQLNATNAIPSLEQALQFAQEPREKTGLMEAINYLKLPEDAPPPPGSSIGTGNPATTSAPRAVAPGTRNDGPAPGTPRVPRSTKHRPSNPRGAPGDQPVSPPAGAVPPQ